MGNFYTNYTLRGPGQQEVARAFAGRKAVVTPKHSGCVVAFDEKSDEQDQEVIAEFASGLSRRFQCVVWTVLNHDDDILWYQLYENGDITDEYNSAPNYFDAIAEPSAPSGGDAQLLCTAFSATDAFKVEAILRKSSFEDGGYVFEFERHADLVRALGLPEFAVGTAYASFECEEYPEGLAPEDLVRTY